MPCGCDDIGKCFTHETETLRIDLQRMTALAERRQDEVDKLNLQNDEYRKALEQIANPPSRSGHWSERIAEDALSEKRVVPGPRCDHGEIMVIHQCAECGEKVDFV